MAGWWSWLLLCTLDLTILASLVSVPLLGAPSLLFGVYVPEDARNDEEIRGVRRQFGYRFGGLALALLAAGIGYGSTAADARTWIVPTVFFLQLASLLATAWLARRSALRIKAARGWQAPAGGRRVASLQFRRQIRVVSGGWYVLHLGVVLLCVAGALAWWDRIPDPLVTHYGIDGQPDGYSRKTVGTVFMLNLVQLFLIGLFVGVHAALRAVRGQLNPDDPSGSMDKELRQRRITSIFMLLVSLLVIIFLGYIQASSLYGWSLERSLVPAMLLPVVLLALVVGILVYRNRHGLHPTESDQTARDDRLWKAGAFYYNPDDPAVFVQKRYGLGWTLNFARPVSWLMLAVVLAVPIAIALLSTLSE